MLSEALFIYYYTGHARVLTHSIEHSSSLCYHVCERCVVVVVVSWTLSLLIYLFTYFGAGSTPVCVPRPKGWFTLGRVDFTGSPKVSPSRAPCLVPHWTQGHRKKHAIVTSHDRVFLYGPL